MKMVIVDTISSEDLGEIDVRPDGSIDLSPLGIAVAAAIGDSPVIRREGGAYVLTNGADRIIEALNTTHHFSDGTPIMGFPVDDS